MSDLLSINRRPYHYYFASCPSNGFYCLFITDLRVFIFLFFDATLDKSISLLPHGAPYGTKLVKCPAWVAATLSGSFNKGVIYRQHGGFAAFSDSHVSVWTEPCTRQRDRVNSLGSTGPKIHFVTGPVLCLYSHQPSFWSFRMAAASHTHSSLQVLREGAVDWNAVQCCCFVVCVCLPVSIPLKWSQSLQASWVLPEWRGLLMER